MTSNPTEFLRKENARLQDENDILKEEVRGLRDFVQILGELYDNEVDIKDDDKLLPLLKHILEKTLAILDAPDGSLMLFDKEKNELVFVLVHGELADTLVDYRIPADEGIAGWVIENAKPAHVPDVRRDNRFSHMIDTTFTFRTQSLIAAPLMGNGRVVGVIEALNQPGDDPFSDHDVALISLLCRIAGERLADIEDSSDES